MAAAPPALVKRLGKAARLIAESQPLLDQRRLWWRDERDKVIAQVETMRAKLAELADVLRS